MPREAWSRIRHVTGQPIEVWADSGDVWIAGSLAVLNAAKREEFAQAWIAACHKADDQVRPVPCGAVSPYAAAACGQYGAHGEHIARGPGGVVLATWPVSHG